MGRGGINAGSCSLDKMTSYGVIDWWVLVLFS